MYTNNPVAPLIACQCITVVWPLELGAQDLGFDSQQVVYLFIFFILKHLWAHQVHERAFHFSFLNSKTLKKEKDSLLFEDEKTKSIVYIYFILHLFPLPPRFS